MPYKSGLTLALESYLAIHSWVGVGVSVAARDFLHNSECTEKFTLTIMFMHRSHKKYPCISITQNYHIAQPVVL